MRLEWDSWFEKLALNKREWVGLGKTSSVVYIIYIPSLEQVSSNLIEQKI